MKNNYGVYFNLLLLSSVVLFFSSCAREKGMISYNNEKLRKQSFEIENSQPAANTVVATTSEDKASVAAIQPEKEINNRITFKNTAKTGLAAEKEIKEGKVSPAKAFIAKKIAEKLDSNKTNRLDKNLKLAIIFGAIGLTLMLFGYPIWLVGAIIFIVGVVFLLLWVLEQ